MRYPLQNRTQLTGLPGKRLATRLLLLTVTITVFLSCEEVFFGPKPGTEPAALFDQVWTFADEEYSFFVYKGVDWDAVRSNYEPLIVSSMNDEKLFGVLADMLFELKDGHVNLVSDFNRSRNWQWYLDYPPNYDYSVLERNYFNGEQQYVGPFIVHEFSVSGGAVGYIHYRSFGSTVRPQDMDYIVNKFKNHKGIIIDVRSNGGGSLSNVYAIANRLTDSRVAALTIQYKNGPGHEDFAPEEIKHLEPPAGTSTFTGPVAVLTNRQCYSATDYFAAMVSALDNVTIIGDTTGGGGGVPAYTLLPNGWQLRVSSSRAFTIDPKVNIEGGISPDITVTSPESELATGTDRILDTAISYLEGLN